MRLKQRSVWTGRCQEMKVGFEGRAEVGREKGREREETCAPGSVSWRGSFKLQVGWTKGHRFKTFVPSARPISELHSQHS